MPDRALPRAAFYALFTASGFAGLIYESIWTHYLKLFFGHAAYAQSLVLVVFMGGMALGSAIAAARSARLANPLLGYAAAEAAVGLLALVFHAVFTSVTDWSHATLLPAMPGEHTALAAKVMVAALLILPQAVLLGMTFPLMSAGLVRAHPASGGESVAMLYFTNSLGAAAGVLASGFVLIGWVGLPGTLQAAGAINLVLAAVVWRAVRPERLAPRSSRAIDERGEDWLLLGVAFLTGLASFAYEISWVRMLSLVLGASTHAFELMLSTFILGLALGGLVVRRQVDRSPAPERLLGLVQVAMGLAALSTLVTYDRMFGLMEFLMKGLARTDAGYALFNLGSQLVCAALMLPATVLAGMTLPLITGTLLRRGTGEAAIGRVYAANTLGAIAGVVLAVHAGLPVLGLKGTVLAASLLDALLGLVLLWRFAGSPRLMAAVTAAAVASFLPVGLLAELDANKMTAGIYRYGDTAGSANARVLFNRDGKTATVHLVEYPGATSIRTNGKSDGSINLDRDGERGSDEITMVLTAAIPLALRPEAKSAAVIGIGTGLTTHTLLQGRTIEAVDTIEIEAAMVEAARGFAPRNVAAFADPRSRIVIEDAKTFFAAGNRRYDLIVSEPSNPWVSGVSSLFTVEFYRRIRGHLNPGGLLVQWFQLYEIEPALLASVITALQSEFPHYVVFAPSDHDLLIVAAEQVVPLPARAHVFDDPGLARELRTIRVPTVGDLDARYLGDRALLAPLFASWGAPPNSDYRPVLDLNAARSRFTEKSATEVVALANLGVPVLEMLGRGPARRPVNPAFEGASSFERVENARLAAYARDFLVNPSPPDPQRIGTTLQKDLEVAKFRLLECREPRERDVWLHALLRTSQQMSPFLPAAEAVLPWDRIMAAPCFADLHAFQREWVSLFRAVAARDGARMARLAGSLLARQTDIGTDVREYLVVAGMTGHLSTGEREAALRLWDEHARKLPRSMPKAAFRLLRCHASAGDCDAAFATAR